MKLHKKYFYLLLFILLQLTMPLQLLNAEARFPAPEFSSGYKMPAGQNPIPRVLFLQYLDVIVLAATLGLAAWLALKKRSRRGLFFLAVFSIIYFGFYRRGCICPVGSLQNFILSTFQSGYILPLTVLFFFLLPLVAALFFGRVFCSSVCPLGSIQEIFIYKPMKLPLWLRQTLGLIPYLMLGLAILYAGASSRFILCEFDPFVSFYRLSGAFWILLLGTLILLASIFVARIYCRFFCAYGVVLGWFSFFSRRHLSITPKECIQCRLCEKACPLEVIDKPTPEEQNTNKPGIKTYLLILGFVILMGFGFSQLSSFLAKADQNVQLANQIYQEEKDPNVSPTLDSTAFRSANGSIEELYANALVIKEKFYKGTWLFGLFMGLVIALKYILRFYPQKLTSYVPNRTLCVSCGRCMEVCPVKGVKEQKK